MTGVVPIDISTVKVEKLTSEERQRCNPEGLCLRCREKGHMAKDYPKRQLQSSTTVSDAPSVPEIKSSPFEGSRLGLLTSIASVNDHFVRVLLDDGSPINVLSRRLMKTLNVKTTDADFAAIMPDGRSHALAETVEPLEIHIGLYQD